MYEKTVHFWTKADDLRQLLLNESRGRPPKNANLVLPVCDPRADDGFIIMESEEYPAMSGSNTICTTTVLLETGMVKMVEPVTNTAAGPVSITADYEAGKCKAVAIDNVPAFGFALDFEVDVPGLGKVLRDIAWSGMMFVILDIGFIGLEIDSHHVKELMQYGEAIKRAVQARIDPVHPENSGMHGVTNLTFTTPFVDEDRITGKKSLNTVVVSPGQLDRSPCGTGACARMAVLHARGLLTEGESFRHISVTGMEFMGKIRGTTKVGEFPAILPTVKSSAWIPSFQQVVLDPTDPFPKGFRVGDSSHAPG